MAMELHILSTEGLPEEGIVVNVSSRPKRQQSALPCQAPFKLEAKPWPVRLDFYAHVARSHSCDWEALSRAGFNSAPFRVSLTSTDGRPMSIELQARESSGKRVISSSLEAEVAAYFEHHKLPNFLRENFDLLIKQRPADPYKFLAQRFHDAAFEEEKASSRKFPLAKRHLINSKAVRQRARIALGKAAQDGRLDSALNRWMGQDAPKQLANDEQGPVQKSLPPIAAVQPFEQAQAWNFNDVSSFLASTVVEEMSSAELEAQSATLAKARPQPEARVSAESLALTAEPAAAAKLVYNLSHDPVAMASPQADTKTTAGPPQVEVQRSAGRHALAAEPEGTADTAHVLNHLPDVVASTVWSTETKEFPPQPGAKEHTQELVFGIEPSATAEPVQIFSHLSDAVVSHMPNTDTEATPHSEPEPEAKIAAEAPVLVSESVAIGAPMYEFSQLPDGTASPTLNRETEAVATRPDLEIHHISEKAKTQMKAGGFTAGPILQSGRIFADHIERVDSAATITPRLSQFVPSQEEFSYCDNSTPRLSTFVPEPSCKELATPAALPARFWQPAGDDTPRLTQFMPSEHGFVQRAGYPQPVPAEYGTAHRDSELLMQFVPIEHGSADKRGLINFMPLEHSCPDKQGAPGSGSSPSWTPRLTQFMP